MYMGQIPLNASLRVMDQNDRSDIAGATVRIKAFVPGQNPVTLAELVTDKSGFVRIAEIPAAVIQKYGELGAKILPEHLRWDINLMKFEPEQFSISGEDVIFLRRRAAKKESEGILSYVPTAILVLLAGVIGYNAFFAKK